LHKKSFHVCRAVPWLRRVVFCFLTRSPGFVPRSFDVRFVTYKVAVGQFFFPRVLCFVFDDVIPPLLPTHYPHFALTRTNLAKSGFFPKRGVLCRISKSVGWRCTVTWLRRLVAGLVATEALVQSQTSSVWDLWWTKWHWDRCMFFGTPSVSTIQPVLRTDRLHDAYTRRANGRNLGAFQKQCWFHLDTNVP